MKPVLRVLLVIDALIFLVAGVVFAATPWLTYLYAPLAPLVMSPAIAGQLYGVALLGLALLLMQGAFNGMLTAAAGKIGGHISWVSGLVLLVWLIALHAPVLSGVNQIAGTAAGIVLLVLGLIQSQLASLVRRREELLAAGAASAARAEAQARAAQAETPAMPLAPKLAVPPRVGEVTPLPSPLAPGRTTPSAPLRGYVSAEPSMGSAPPPDVPEQSGRAEPAMNPRPTTPTSIPPTNEPRMPPRP